MPSTRKEPGRERLYVKFFGNRTEDVIAYGVGGEERAGSSKMRRSADAGILQAVMILSLAQGIAKKRRIATASERFLHEDVD